MKFIQLFFLLFIPCTGIICGQSAVNINRKDFKTDKPGFDAAWQHVKDGNSFYSKGGVWYKDAMNEYKIAYVYNNKNAELNYKLGISCLYSDKKEAASEYLLKALTLKADVADDILFVTGRALQYTGQYSEAVKKFNEWLSSGVKKTPENIERANRYIAECKSAESVPTDTLRIEVRNIGAGINSADDDYSEVLSHDGEKMYFASRRAVSDKSKNYYDDTKLDENIYRSDIENGKWSVSLPAAKNINSELCETPLDIDPTGTILYIYSGFEGNGDIKVAKFKRGEWRSPEPESFGINSRNPETSFSMSPSGKEIAFISDRGKKGLGGRDVYFMYRNDRKWSKPINAGENINSISNEESVRFSRGGDTLWFSSSGRNTTGGFDIYYSIRKSGGAWTPALNAGNPVNSQWDELFYFPSPVNDSLFYFVSNRAGGFGGLDIYTGRIRQEIPLKPVLPVVQQFADPDSIPKNPVQPANSIVGTDSSTVKKSIIN